MKKYQQQKPSLFEDAIAVARLIPFGRVITYGAIAEYIGAKRSARMVGWAMNTCKGDATVPAHRVVNRVGLLTGKMHFDTLETMQALLEKEGIEIQNNQIQNFKKVFWNPSEEL